MKEYIEKLENKKGRIFIYMFDSQGEMMASQYEAYRMCKELVDGGYDARILFDDSKRLDRIKSLENERAKLSKMPNQKEELDRISVELSIMRDYRNRWVGKEFDKLKISSLSELENKPIDASDMMIFPEYAKAVAYQIKDMPAMKVLWVNNLTSLINSSTNNLSIINDLKIKDFIVSSKEMQNWIIDNFPLENNYIKFHIYQPKVGDSFKPSLKKPKVAVFGRNADDLSFLHKIFCQRYPMLSWIPFEVFRNIDREEFGRKLGECAVGVQLDRKSSYGTFLGECITSKVIPISLISDFPTPFDRMIPMFDRISDVKNKEMGVHGDLVEAVYHSLLKFLESDEKSWNEYFSKMEFSDTNTTSVGIIQELVQERLELLKK